MKCSNRIIIDIATMDLLPKISISSEKLYVPDYKFF